MSLSHLIRIASLVSILISCVATQAQQQVVPLYPGVAPGSEGWKQKETISPSPMEKNVHFVRNIVNPTLTVFLPKANPTGTAVIIVPGGGFHFVTWESEGTQVADWLTERGITAFILKYRVLETGATEEEFQAEMKQFFEAALKRPKTDPNAPLAPEPNFNKIVPLAAEDGRQAVRIVRQRASEWKIDPERIGIMGFSAGGVVATEVLLHHTPESRPNFVAPIYAPQFGEFKVPQDAPPLFILAADDDPIVPSTSSARLYTAWHGAGKPAEVHIYSKGGHGFGMLQHGFAIDRWIDLYFEWMKSQGLLKQNK